MAGRRLARLVGILSAATLSGVAAGEAARADAGDVAPILDTAGPFRSVGGAVVNEDGAFAFLATPDDILARTGVYRTDEASDPLLLFQESSGGLGIGVEVSGGPGIDDAGRVYYSTISYQQGFHSSRIRVSDEDEPLVESAEGPLELAAVGRNGSFVYLLRDAYLGDAGPDSDVVHRRGADGSEVTITAVAPGAIGSLAFDGAETVAYRLQDAPDYFRIMVANGDQVQTVVWPMGPFACGSPSGCFGPFVSIEPSGRVAFRALFDGGSGVGIFTRTGLGPIESWVDSRGPFAQVGLPTAGSGPVAGGGGRIAFLGSLDVDPSRYGIYIGPDPEADRVIQEGDPLFDSVVEELWIQDFHAVGTLAFVALLEDGRQVLVRAEPVPEPGPAACAAAALAPLLAARRIRR